MQRKRLYIIALLLALLIPTAIVAAAGTVTLDNFQIDLVGHEPGPNDTEIFTYAVTDLGASNALSHWTLGIDTCLEYLVEPQPGSYTTATGIPECGGNPYTCESAEYTVVTGNDPTLGINGIKFEDGVPQLSTGTTHVFQITVEEFAGVELVDVGTKTGGAETNGQIDGPICGTTTAVSLASTNVDSAPLGTLLPMLLGLMIVLAGVTLFVLRRAQLAAVHE